MNLKSYHFSVDNRQQLVNAEGRAILWICRTGSRSQIIEKSESSSVINTFWKFSVLLSVVATLGETVRPMNFNSVSVLQVHYYFPLKLVV